MELYECTFKSLGGQGCDIVIAKDEVMALEIMQERYKDRRIECKFYKHSFESDRVESLTIGDLIRLLESIK